MTQLGFSPDFMELTEDSYMDESSTMALQIGDTDQVPWENGVKHGYPLSPLLFDICLEPLSRKLKEKDHIGYGIESEYSKEKAAYNVLAYADDLILLSQTEEHMYEALATLD
jgi:hypothetical protein